MWVGSMLLRNAGGGDCFVAPDAGGGFQVRRGDGHTAHRRRSGIVVTDRMDCQSQQPDEVKLLRSEGLIK